MTYVRKDESGCWIWVGGKCAKRMPYGSFRAFGKMTKAHIFSYAMFRGQVPQGMCVCHTCDVCECVNPDHLWIGTKAENNRDRDAKGRSVKVCGSSHHASRLRERDVREIRVLIKEGERIADIARYFTVSDSAISDIVAGRTWRHVS